MTEKLYEQDSYLAEFSARLISVNQAKNLYRIILNKTAFFPEGGGQAYDAGTIGGASVVGVYIEDGEIAHYTDSMPADCDGTVLCRVDMDVRFPRMQSHSGEHILSGLILKNYGFNNVGFHMSEKSVTVDYDGILSEENIRFIETRANECVYKNETVRTYYLSCDQLLNLDYRSKLKPEAFERLKRNDEKIRIVELGSFDTCACCAPHVTQTGEIGIIKIIDFIRYKGGTRITLLCGKNALLDYCNLNGLHREEMQILSSKRLETKDALNRHLDDESKLKADYKNLRVRYLDISSEDYGYDFVKCVFLDNADYEEMRNVINLRIKKNQEENPLFIAFSMSSADEFLFFASTENASISVADFVKKLTSVFSGKGGGKRDYAQGRILADKGSICLFLEEYGREIRK